MSDIKKEEMFGNLKSFLKSRGIEIQEGSYANGIRKGCDILTDTVNMSQRAFDRAKDAADKGLDQVRQTVHEYTAPKSKTAGAKTAASGGQTRTKSSAGKTASAKTKTASAKAKKRGK
jgi:hypothetical protein